jgi:hypothetical protein
MRLPQPEYAVYRADADHNYKIQFRDGFERIVPGVTGRLSNVGGGKVEGLKWWASKLAVDYFKQLLAQDYEAIVCMSKPAFREYLEMAREEAYRSHKRKLEYHSEYGTQCHTLFEKVVLGRPIDILNPFGNGKIAMRGVLGAVDRFRHWWSTANLEVVATELAVGSRRHGCAGTMDLLARYIDGPNRGEFVIGDYKNSGSLKVENAAQGAAYGEFLAEQYGITPKHILVIRVPNLEDEYRKPNETESVQAWRPTDDIPPSMLFGIFLDAMSLGARLKDTEDLVPKPEKLPSQRRRKASVEA